MLCLSGFELYSRWVPPNLVFQIYQIYQIPSLCTDSPGEGHKEHRERKSPCKTVPPLTFCLLLQFYHPFLKWKPSKYI